MSIGVEQGPPAPAPMNPQQSRRRFLATLWAILLGVACQPVSPDPSPIQPVRHERLPQLRVEPRVGLSGQRATVTVAGLGQPSRTHWRWARLTVESPDGTVPVDSLWAVPAHGPTTRTWRLSGEGPTIVTLSLYGPELEWPDWQTEFLLDTHELVP